MLKVAAAVLALTVASMGCTTRHKLAPGTPLPPDRTNHVVGALQGAGLGLVSGAALGAAVGYADGDDQPCGPQDFFCLSFSAGDKAVLAGLYGGLAGAAVGLVVGAAVGKRDVYEYGEVPQLHVTAGAGGGAAAVGWRF